MPTLLLLVLCFAHGLNSLDTNCNTLLPGMYYMIAGINRASADIRAIPYPASAPVLALTCNQGKKYLDPYTGKYYDQPDQVGNIIPIGGQQTDITTYLNDNVYRLELQMNAEEDVDVNYIIGSFSESASVQASLNLFINKDTSVGIAKSTILAYQIFFNQPDSLIITDDLMNYLAKFNGHYVFDFSTVGIYNTMFGIYGTDILQQGIFGGEACYNYFCEKIIYRKETEVDVQVDASNSLFNIILAAGGASGSKKTVSANYLSYCTYNMVWRGGMPPFTNFNNWSATVPLNPAPLKIDMISVANVFTFNATLQQNTEIARINYLDTSLLTNEILPSLNMFVNILNVIVIEIGTCIIPSYCQSYPSYPSCGVYTCPGTCPNTNTDCGASVQCCSYTDPTYYQTQVNSILATKKEMISDCNSLINQTTTLLQSPILNHTEVVNVYNAYFPLMQSIETIIMDFDCSVAYMHSEFPCMKWSSITPTQCKSSASSIATSCPNPNSQSTYATFKYFRGMTNYTGANFDRMEEPLRQFAEAPQLGQFYNTTILMMH